MSRARTVSRVGGAQPPSLAGLLGWGLWCGECCPVGSSEPIKAVAMHGTARAPLHPSIEIRWWGREESVFIVVNAWHPASLVLTVLCAWLLSAASSLDLVIPVPQGSPRPQLPSYDSVESDLGLRTTRRQWPGGSLGLLVWFLDR